MASELLRNLTDEALDVELRDAWECKSRAELKARSIALETSRR